MKSNVTLKIGLTYLAYVRFQKGMLVLAYSVEHCLLFLWHNDKMAINKL